MGGAAIRASSKGLKIHMTLCAQGQVVRCEPPQPLAVTLFSCIAGLVRPTTWHVGQLAMGMDSTTIVSAPTQSRKQMEGLTLNDHVLTCFLVPLALATNLVGQPITLITERMAALEPWITLYCAI